jgi:uncharacterized protein (TIGR02145 family)
MRSFAHFIFVMAGMLVLISVGCQKETDSPVTGKFIDSRDQKEYKWVIIGTQTWMSENLAYLPRVSQSLYGSDTLPFYYVFRYEGSETTAAKEWEFYADYGVFYNWPAAMNGADSSNLVPSGVQGICPDGWHLPSDGEWDILVNHLEGEYKAGKYLKSRSGWNSFKGNTGNGDNSSGFNALAAGSRHNGGGFYNLGFNAIFWSSTGYGENSAWYRHLAYFHNGVYRYFSNPTYGFSVRCVKDSN